MNAKRAEQATNKDNAAACAPAGVVEKKKKKKRGRTIQLRLIPMLNPLREPSVVSHRRTAISSELKHSPGCQGKVILPLDCFVIEQIVHTIEQSTEVLRSAAGRR
jgi:hypothetical protein